jgi:ABC-type bacteriocin/lantibiotic exporter with double-glycine peptidase domain
MNELPVPFVRQINENACGAAAYEMVSKYHGRKIFSQHKAFRKKASLEPTGTGNYQILTDDVVSLAVTRRLHAGWGRVRPEADRLRVEIAQFIGDLKIPPIACVWFRPDLHQLGHFCVIIGYDATGVLAHDPLEGERLAWSWDHLLARWSQTGGNVTGGVAVWIAKNPIPSGFLDPDQPNAWDGHRWSPSVK